MSTAELVLKKIDTSNVHLRWPGNLACRGCVFLRAGDLGFRRPDLTGPLIPCGHLSVRCLPLRATSIVLSVPVIAISLHLTVKLVV